MLVPQTVEYALRAVLHIANAERGGPVRVHEIADALDLPQNYLSKTLNVLAHSGVLLSTRGPAGGFRLAQPVERLTLAAVAAPFMTLGERTCLLGQSACRDDRPCAAHTRWKAVVGLAEEFFARTTVADLVTHDARAPRRRARRRGAPGAR